MSKPAAAVAAVGMMLLVGTSTAWGIQRIGLAVEAVSHPLVTVDDVSVELDLGPSGGGASGRLRAGSIRVGDRRAGPLTVHCGALRVTRGRVRCDRAAAHLAGEHGPPLELQGTITVDPGDRLLHAQLRIDGAGPPGTLRLQGTADGGTLEVSLPAIPLELLGRLEALAGWSLQGRASVDASITADAAGTIDGTVALALEEATVASGDGRMATEGLEATGLLRLRGDAAELRGMLSLHASAGLAYADPVLLDTGAHPVDLVATVLHRGGSTWLEKLHLQQPGLLQARGQARLNWQRAQPLQSARLQVDELALPAGYDTYLQPFLIGTVLDRVSVRGGIAGELSVRDGRADWFRLRADGVDLDDRRGRFAVAGLSGSLHWTRDSSAPPSRLRWQEGSIYRVAIGASELDFELTGDSLRLRQPLGVPVADGRLRLDHLEATGLGTEAFRATLEGRLEPVSLEALSRALEWPVLPGTLSGRIPRVTYREGRLDLDGVLEAEVFGGRVTVPRLRVNNPMGRVPQLQTDIRLRGLDLEQITGTYAFGRITGRLDGDVTGLELIDWEPVAFDARFYTPEDAPGSRRISQRAIENIADLGGDAGTALISGTFLRLFENFRYRRLGIRCRLRDDQCRMSGVHPAESGGYYLVQGTGVPRVDVIGYTREVDWPTLLQQLQAVTGLSATRAAP
ncbi:hypothetical protein QWY84_16255 [Aquisalimonas lutea]|uniref:hypothetical protein n=1 Tax=Aquisalimonas lutea TaxID=1327750 RepID=UPI0025B3C0A5|nr:hypothetical protein [Aquisalimonas lutea]MDN3519167.1 hypothetical protein [Aquisalimonas lutea]